MHGKTESETTGKELNQPNDKTNMKRRMSKHHRKTKKSEARPEAKSSSISSPANTSSSDQNSSSVGDKVINFFERTKQDLIEGEKTLLQGSKFVSQVLRNIPGLNDVSSDNKSGIEGLLSEPNTKEENRDDTMPCDNNNDLNVRDDASPLKTRNAKLKTTSGKSLLSATRKRLMKKRTVPIQMGNQQNRMPATKNADNEASTKDEKSIIDSESNDVTKTASTISPDGEKKESENRSVISVREMSDNNETPKLLPDVSECEQKEIVKRSSSDEIEVMVSPNPSEDAIVMSPDENVIYSVVGCAPDRITASTEIVKKEDRVYEGNQFMPPVAKSMTLPGVSSDTIISSSFDKNCPLGPGKVYHYLEQLRVEAIYADKTIQTLQIELEKLKKSNEILEARGKEYEQFTRERNQLNDLKKKNKELQNQNSKLDKKYNEVNAEKQILDCKIKRLQDRFAELKESLFKRENVYTYTPCAVFG